MNARATRLSDAAAFLATLPPTRAREISRVRDVVLKHLPPGYEEVGQKNMLVYQVPLSRFADTYNGHPLWYAALAAPKTYLTLHLMPVYGSEKLARQLAERFHSAGKRLDIGKGCIRFHSADDLALDAIAEVIGAVPVDQWIEIARSSRTGSRR